MVNAHFIDHLPQANDFSLWRYRLDTDIELPINFFVDIHGERYELFSQLGEQISFLKRPSTVSIDAPDRLEIRLDGTPDSYWQWQYVDDFLKQHDLTARNAEVSKTLCLWVAEDKMAQAFMLAKPLKSLCHVVMILESEHAFPFQIKPARFLVESLPDEAISAIGACPLLEDWGIPNRLCHMDGLPGCFEGSLQTLRQCWSQPEHWQSITL